MPKLPSAFETLGTVEPQPARFTPRATAPDLHAAEIGAGIRRFGQGIEQAGLILKERQDNLEATNADTHLMLGLDKLYNDLKDDPDYQNAPQKFEQQGQQLLGESAGQISSPYRKQLFMDKGLLQMRQHQQVLTNEARKRGRDEQLSYHDQQIDQIQKNQFENYSEEGGHAAMSQIAKIVQSEWWLTHRQQQMRYNEKVRNYIMSLESLGIKIDPVQKWQNYDELIGASTPMGKRSEVPTTGTPVAVDAHQDKNLFSSGRAQRMGISGDVGKNLDTIQVGDKSITVNAQAAPHFKGFLDELAARGYDLKDVQGYNARMKRGSFASFSEHAFGNAIDINPDKNPFHSRQTDLPPDISKIAAKYGLIWGGDWSGNSADPMHFEWSGKGGMMAADQGTKETASADQPTPTSGKGVQVAQAGEGPIPVGQPGGFGLVKNGNSGRLTDFLSADDWIKLKQRAIAESARQLEMQHRQDQHAEQQKKEDQWHEFYRTLSEIEAGKRGPLTNEEKSAIHAREGMTEEQTSKLDKVARGTDDPATIATINKLIDEGNDPRDFIMGALGERPPTITAKSAAAYGNVWHKRTDDAQLKQYDQLVKVYSGGDPDKDMLEALTDPGKRGALIRRNGIWRDWYIMSRPSQGKPNLEQAFKELQRMYPLQVGVEQIKDLAVPRFADRRPANTEELNKIAMTTIQHWMKGDISTQIYMRQVDILNQYKAPLEEQQTIEKTKTEAAKTDKTKKGTSVMDTIKGMLSPTQDKTKAIGSDVNVQQEE